MKVAGSQPAPGRGRSVHLPRVLRRGAAASAKTTESVRDPVAASAPEHSDAGSWGSWFQRRTSEEEAPRRRAQPSEGLDVAMRAMAAWSARFLLIVAAAFVLWRILDAIGLVTITLTVSVMISAVLRPGVNALHRGGLPRWLAATLVFFVGVAIMVLMTWFVISQITNNMDIITFKLQDASLAITEWLRNGPAQMSPEQTAQISAEVARQLTNTRGDFISAGFSTASSLFGVISGVILCLFSLLFLLLDDGAIWRWVVSLFPPGSLDRVEEGGRVAWRTLVAYMRSTVFLAVINALTMVIIMMIAKMELVVPLGVLLFLGSLIPLVGMLVAGGVLVLIAWVMHGPVIAIVMLVALFLTVQLEGNLLNPYILGKAVNIHPLAILATVTGGTLVGGIFGAFTAVPLVAIINNVTVALRPNVETPVPLLDEEELPVPAPATTPTPG